MIETGFEGVFVSLSGDSISILGKGQQQKVHVQEMLENLNLSSNYTRVHIKKFYRPQYK